MGRKVTESRIEVQHGLYVYLRNSNIYQVYFKLRKAKKAFRKSLWTPNLDEAKRLAVQEFEDAKLRQAMGKPELKVSFEKLKKEYLASKGSDPSAKYHRETINRHFAPFFSERVPDFCELTAADVDDYLIWRREKDSDVKNATLNRENVVLRQMVKYAVRRSYLPKDSAPTVPQLSAEASRRPNFTNEEYKTLHETARRRIGDEAHPLKREQRRLLFHWIIFMANSGLRPAEASNLKWRDVHFGSGKKDKLYLQVSDGKTGKRDVVGKDAIMNRLKAIKKRNEAFASKNGLKVGPTDYVFCVPILGAKKKGKATPSLKRVKSFKKGFNSLLVASGFQYDDDEKKHSPYSLRHTYATIRLDKGTGIYILAKNMGTSVRMIEKHYGHVLTRQHRDELTKMRI